MRSFNEVNVLVDANERDSSNDSLLGTTYHYGNQFYQQYICSNIGSLLVLVYCFFNSVMSCCSKLLETDKNATIHFNPFQILFIRLSVTYMCCLAYMAITKSVGEYPFGPLKVRHLLTANGILSFISMLGFIYSLQYLSISDAMSLKFIGPMITGVLAWVILHEDFSFVQGLCAILSFVGVILIAKPGFIFSKVVGQDSSTDDEIETSLPKLRLIAICINLIGVLGSVGSYLTVKKIGIGIHPLLPVSYFALCGCCVSFLVLLIVPSYHFLAPNSGNQYMLFLIISITGFIGQLSLTAGIQRIGAGAAGLLSYSNMVFALVWDIIIWQHFPGFFSCLGMTMIIICAVIVVRFKSTKEITADAEANVAPSYDELPLDKFEIRDEGSEENLPREREHTRE